MVVALFRSHTRHLNDPSQPPPFSMPSILLMLRGEAKCFTVSCVPILKVSLIIFSCFAVISFVSTCYAPNKIEGIEHFFRVYIASSKHEEDWENSRQLCKPET